MQREPIAKRRALFVYTFSPICKKESPFSRKKEMRYFASYPLLWRGVLRTLRFTPYKGRLRVGEKFYYFARSTRVI